MGRELLDQLRDAVEDAGLLRNDTPLEERLAEAVKIPQIREILEIETPKITNLTPIITQNYSHQYAKLEYERTMGGTIERFHWGSVYAIRMDWQSLVPNHKKPVVAALILRNVLLGNLPSDQKDTLIDAGNFNSALAVKYYAQKFGMKGVYIMSRLFPQGITSLLESDDFRIVRAPKKYEQKREREFYEHLAEQMQNREFRKNKVCLWHAKYGGRAHYPLGRELAEAVGKKIGHLDYIVSCLGAGSTLEGIQIPIQDYYEEQHCDVHLCNVPKIVIAEHKSSPLFTAQYRKKVVKPDSSDYDAGVVEEKMKGFGWNKNGVRRSSSVIPHDILGPHFDEINPLLSKASIDRIDEVVQYPDGAWRSMQDDLFGYGISVGNSSAANVAVAAKLSYRKPPSIPFERSETSSVLTVIFEPYWSFYGKAWV